MKLDLNLIRLPVIYELMIKLIKSISNIITSPISFVLFSTRPVILGLALFKQLIDLSRGTLFDNYNTL